MSRKNDGKGKTKAQAKFIETMNEQAKFSPSKQIAIYEKQIKVSFSSSEQDDLRRRIEVLKTGSEAEKIALTQAIRATKQAETKIRSSLPSKTREKGRWASIVGGGKTGLKR